MKSSGAPHKRTPERQSTVRRSDAPTSAPRRRLLLPAALVLLAAICVRLYPVWTEYKLRTASLSELQERARRDPTDPQAAYYLGLQLQKAGQMDAARDSFAHAAKQDVHDEASWLAWAEAAGQAGGSREAFGILELFVKNNPTSERAHLALCRLFQQKSAFDAAYDEAMIAAKLNPQDASAWRYAGEAAQNRKRDADAEAAMRKAVALSPNDWHNQVGLGNALAAQEKHDEAVACFRKAVQLAPKEAVPALALGKALMVRAVTPDQTAAACGDIERAISLNSGIPLAYLLLGQCYAQEQHWQEAQNALIQAEKRMPDDAEVHYQLARVYLRLGNTKEGEREARIHTDLINYALAKKRLSELSLKGNDITVLIRWARLLRDHGEYAQAADIYRGILARAPKMQSVRAEFARLQKQHPQ